MATCIKTGAYLELMEYGEFLLCDLYQEGEVIFTAANTIPTFEMKRNVTHQVRIRDGFFQRNTTHTVLVVPAQQVYKT